MKQAKLAGVLAALILLTGAAAANAGKPTAKVTVREAIDLLDSLPPIERVPKVPFNPTADLIQQLPTLEVYRAKDQSYFWIRKGADGEWHDHGEVI